MKQIVIAVLGLAFLASLLFVQWMEILRKREEAGLVAPHIVVAADSRRCVECHEKETPGIVDHWTSSTHAAKGIGCIECHKAEEGDLDAFNHEGALIATIVTPKDCGACHDTEFDEFTRSHHSKAGNILHSLDNFLAETVEGGRQTGDGETTVTFNPHSKTPGHTIESVNGLAAAFTGCQQCHGSMVALKAKDGGMVTMNDILVDDETKLTDDDKQYLDEQKQALAAPEAEMNADEKGWLKNQRKEPVTAETTLTEEEIAHLAKGRLRTRKMALAKQRIDLNADGKPVFHPGTWPNTGIGRLNLDGSRGSCSACHSRHDFSPRRARQPENCGKCHLGPDHPQKEIYEESKHGIAFRDLKDQVNLDATDWVLGEDYTVAPTCATCHLSANSRDRKITHDPGERISWTNRPPVSLAMDTDKNHKVIKSTDPVERAELLADGGESWATKRDRMKNVCSHCHTPDYVNSFYQQYDDFVVLYNEKFAKPGKAIMGALGEQGLKTATPFDEEIEWTWFYLWHHEGRRARHGASMMAPDYAHWHGTYEVAERFYMEMIPQAREIIEHARSEGKQAEAQAVEDVIEAILARPEHQWFEKDKHAAAAEAAPAGVTEPVPPAEPEPPPSDPPPETTPAPPAAP